MVASARGLEFNEDESGTFLLEDRKLSPNEAISADKRAYSRAVLVCTDAVALLQDPRYWGDDAYFVRCAVDLQNRKVRAEPESAYVSAQKQRVHRAKERRARAAADNCRLCANVLLVAIAMSECLSVPEADTSASVRGSADTYEWVNHNGASSLQIES
jgi:hypothetical protein